MLGVVPLTKKEGRLWDAAKHAFAVSPSVPCGREGPAKTCHPRPPHPCLPADKPFLVRNLSDAFRVPTVLGSPRREDFLVGLLVDAPLRAARHHPVLLPGAAP